MLSNSRDIIRRLEREGWTHAGTTGSHHHFKRDGFREIITVPHPKKDLGKGLASKIAKQAGWK